MEEQFESIITKFDGLTNQLADETVLKDPSRYQRVAKERADLEETIKVIDRLKGVYATLRDNEGVIKAGEDEELVELATAEMEELTEEKD